MTKAQLYQYISLKKEIESEGLRLKRLEELAMQCSFGFSDGVLVHTTADKTATAAEIADCKAVIKKRIESCIQHRKGIEGFIQGTPDSYMRRVLTLRYINGLTWSEVSRQMGCLNQKSIEMQVERYLRKTEINKNKGEIKNV